MFDEKEMIRRLQRGDASALKVIYEEYKDELFTIAAHHLYYLDPERDFLCVRNDQRSDVALDKDPSWLEGVDPQTIPPATLWISKTTDFAQIKGAGWCPSRKEIEWHRDTSKGAPQLVTREISVKVDPEFPPGLFDPDKLPK